MAITNAQQYQQLVNKPADGKRPGYRGDAAYGKSSRSAQATSIGQAQGATGKGGGASLGGGRDKDETPAQQIIGGKSYPVTPENRKQREDLVEEQRQLREIEKKKFIYEPANYPKYTPGYIKFLGNLNREPNRRYFVNKVLQGKNASALLNRSLGLDEDGLSFSPFDLTEEQFEKAYQDYMTDRMSGKTDAMGNINPSFGRDDGPDQPIIPIIPEPVDPGEEDDDNTTPTRNLGGLAPRFAGSIFDFTGLADGGRVPAMGGGIMNTDIVGGFADGSIDEMGRQMYGLGKLVKKATRAVKKVAKSPLGKAALIGAAGFGIPGTSFGGLFGTAAKKGLLGKYGIGQTLGILGKSPGALGGKTPGFSGFLQRALGFAKDNPMLTIGGLSALPFLFGQQDDEEEYDSYRGPSIDIANIRNNPYNFLAPRFQGTRFAADGGIMRTGYQEGGDAEPVAKKTMPLIDMDGKEKDYRETGGFVDMGRMERADDVPARLSKNEFVFTADAVRNAGDGDIDKGAEVMYNMMKNLEDGGDVSEESQGLEGARNMFQTSQRLEEVL